MCSGSVLPSVSVFTRRGCALCITGTMPAKSGGHGRKELSEKQLHKEAKSSQRRATAATATKSSEAIKPKTKSAILPNQTVTSSRSNTTSPATRQQQKRKTSTSPEGATLHRKHKCVVGSNESLFSATSDASGILSDIDPDILPDTQEALRRTTVSTRSDPADLTSCPVTEVSVSTSPTPTPEIPAQPSVTPLKSRRAARVDLTQNNNPDLIATSRHLLIAGTDPHRRITTLNPLKLQTDIDAICGPISKMEYLKNGTIIATTFTATQTDSLLRATILPSFNLPISVSIAWARQFTYGKIYAPELSQDSLEEVLEALAPHRVVAVRKLLSDPAKSHVPLYVLTFLGLTPPSLRLGYVNYTIDRYYPTPLRCRKCWRLRHSTQTCRSLPTCTFCSSTTHTHLQCTSLTPKCINCKGAHESLSPHCPMLQTEQEICTTQADLGISFAEARQRTSRPSTLLLPRAENLQSTATSSVSPTLYTPSGPPPSTSVVDFPVLPPSASRATPTVPHSHSHFDFSCITPGQYLQRSQPAIDSYQGQDLCSQAPSELSLPPLTPRSQTLPPSSSYSERLTTNLHVPPSPSDIQNKPWISSDTFAKFVPLLIKLLFASTITDKIECITELGHLLDLHAIISSTLSSLQLSSSTSQQ